MTERLKYFNRALRKIVVPSLKQEGFAFDGNRTFRKLSKDGTIAEIINFQVGQRSLEGKFTVNLGVFFQQDNLEIEVQKAKEYDCPWERRERIGFLVPSRWPRLAKIPYIGWLFGPREKWWTFSNDQTETESCLSVALIITTGVGTAWLSSKTQ